MAGVMQASTRRWYTQIVTLLTSAEHQTEQYWWLVLTDTRVVILRREDDEEGNPYAFKYQAPRSEVRVERFTRTGIALRAVAVDPEVAAWMGVPVHRMISVTFAVGGALAGLAGALFATLFPIDPFFGSSLVIKGFAVALLGGLGNVGGAVLAALILAMAETFVSGYLFPQWTTAFAFGLIVLILLVRPSGLFRGTEGANL